MNSSGHQQGFVSLTEQAGMELNQDAVISLITYYTVKQEQEQQQQVIIINNNIQKGKKSSSSTTKTKLTTLDNRCITFM